MLSAALSASRRGFLLLAVVLTTTLLSLGLVGCAGVVSGNGGQNNLPTPLVIMNVQISAGITQAAPVASGATTSSVRVSWVTNIPATSEIEYGTTAAYGATTPVDGSMVTNHQMALTNLAPGTTYHCRVRSTAGSSAAVSNDHICSPAGGSTAPPTIAITSPATGATVSGNVNVTAAASDNAGVASVQFRLDGGNIGTSLAAAPYAFTLNTTTLSNGNHTISVVATDTAGNSTTSAGVTVTVNNTTKDTTPPTVTLISPAAGATVSGTVAVTATATDNVSVATVQFQLDGANVGAIDNAAPYGYLWDSTKTTNGSHSLRAIATDGAGNSTASASVTVTVNNTIKDTTPPTVAITAPANGAKVSGTIAVSANATDNVSVASVQFLLDGASVGAALLASPYSYSWDTTKTSNGSHLLTAIAKDGAGNSATSAAVTVSVNNATTPQTFTISGTLSPSAGGSGATVTLSGASGATTTANSAGAYTFTGLANGSYTVTPSHAGYTFSPASQPATIASANVTGLNFTATATPPPTFTVSGTLSPTTGGGGATVSLSGASSATVTSNSSGTYSFTGLAAGSYAVTPSHTGFTFNPTSQSATITSANVKGVNFTATPVAPSTFTISGTITPTSGGSGATVTLSGPAGATTTTNSSGAYTFTGLANGNYSVTPSNSGFAFTPANRSVTVSGANQTGVNFVAASTKPHSVALTWSPSSSTVSGYNVYRSTVNGSGYTKLNSGLVGGTSYDDANVQSGTTYFYVTTSVDSAGLESGYSNQATAAIP
jgi:hypothetical protein